MINDLRFSKSFSRGKFKINKWGKNVYVKIPVLNSKGIFMGSVIKELSNKGIKLNITAVYTFKQTVKIVKSLNIKTKSIKTDIKIERRQIIVFLLYKIIYILNKRITTIITTNI